MKWKLVAAFVLVISTVLWIHFSHPVSWKPEDWSSWGILLFLSALVSVCVLAASIIVWLDSRLPKVWKG